MAKKGGVQQLQTEVNTDEDFEKCMDRDGLLVMDVYTDWCGPCIGMIGSLKKIKLELGGDNLQLAVCKSDGISCLQRFRNKSEPTWLFGSSKKIINLMFGTNVPKLMKLIADELEIEKKYRNKEIERTFYEWTELTPIEQEREDARIAIENEQIRIEKEAAELERRQYIINVTDEIIDHIPDMGVTIIFPHLAKERDIFKKLTDPADKCDLITKDKKFIQIKEEDLEILHFECANPLPDPVLEQIFGVDLMAIVWKTADAELRQVEEVIETFVDIVTIPQPLKDEDGNPNPELTMPPMLKPFEIILKDEVVEEVVEKEEGEDDDATEKNNEDETEEKETVKENEEPTAEIALKEEVPAAEVPTEEVPESEEKPAVEKEVVEGEEDVAAEEKPETESISDEKEKSSKETIVEQRTMKIPALWTPANKRANAAMILLYFRNLTDHFLPPDPIPDPPHVAVVFDAFKRQSVWEVMEQYNDAILAYGYFTSGDPKTAELIAKSTDAYQKKKPLTEDKLIVKVAKVTSHALLSLVAMGPCYVSLNTESGKEECIVYFPTGFTNVEEEEEQEVELVEKKKGKRGRKGKHKKESGATTDATSGDLEEEEAENGDEGEDEDEDEDEDESQTATEYYYYY